MDPDVEILASLSSTIRPDYQDPSNKWDGSPFDWIRSRPSRQRGAIAERLVAGWCAAKGADVTRSTSSQADRYINGHRYEIKFSTLWESGVYKFQQIRDQEYDYLLCLGLAPFEASCWVIPKSILLDHVIGFMGQHTGAAGTDTAWISFRSNRPYEWMQPYGGTLADAWEVIESLGRGQYR
ncbi:MAG: hypothetical protein KDB03_28325 [Planctomycetales bacterium]|nr:hypothetical protein [Planctomycetales bacterium]